jgi:TolA-binding protein
MKTRKIVLFGSALLVCAGTTLQAKPPAQDHSTTSAINETKPPEARLVPVDVQNLTPMHREIRESLETEQARVQELNRRFIEAVLLSEKIAIQKEIEEIKKGGQVAVLEIQLRYARSEARPQDVKQLEAAIEALKNPKPLRGSGVPLVEQSRAPGK